MGKWNRWTIDSLKKEASKYTTRMDFERYSKTAYTYANKHHFLQEIGSHLVYTKARWSDERIMERAKKYNTRGEFLKYDRGAYDASLRSGKHNYFCDHMEMKTTNELRDIYLIEFGNKIAYVGISYNVKNRIKHHKENRTSPLYSFLNDGRQYRVSILYENLSPKEASKKEKEEIAKYKDMGYTMLNKSDGGELSGIINIWSEENLKKEALKYNTKRDFMIGNPKAWKATYHKKLQDIVCAHMPVHTSPINKYTVDKLYKITSNYDDVGKFRKGNKGAYESARKQGILNDVCSHMVRRINQYVVRG